MIGTDYSLNNFSDQVKLRIASFCTAQSLGRLGSCNRSFEVICRDNGLWKKLHAQLKLDHTGEPYLVQVKRFYSRFVEFINFEMPLFGRYTVLKTKSKYEKFIEECKKHPPELREKLHYYAISRRFSDIAMHFFRTKFSTMTADNMLEGAFRNRDEELALEIIRKEQINYDGITNGDDDSVFHQFAIRAEQPECLRLLLTQLPIDERLRNRLVLQCFADDHPEKILVEMLQAILTQTISQKARMLAVKAARQQSAVQVLLQTGKLPERNYDLELLYEAASENDHEKFKASLNCDPILIMMRSANFSICEFFLDQLVQRSMKENNMTAIRFLLNYGALSETVRSEAVVHCAELDDIETVRLLLKNGPISENECSLAMNREDAPDELVELLNDCYNEIEMRRQEYQQSVFKPNKKPRIGQEQQ